MNKSQITIPCTGYAIAADQYTGADNNNVLLVIVGYSSTKARNAEFVTDLIKETGSSALVLDLSGHGESPFSLDDTKPAQHLLEVAAAFDWLVATYPEVNISVMGTSYGGYMAAWLSRFRKFHKLVLRTPALYRPADFYSPHGLIHKTDELVAYRANTDEIARNPLFLQNSVFTGPTFLVVHGNDEDIPVATSDLYQKDFKAETYLAEDFVHALRDPRNPQSELLKYKEAIANWL